ncbi:hypothetical protein DXG03_001100 [Asterophora parasitica]|uniref:Uncharacterized protein n=1 Tax=Asterophora parasitica TaxID=117018 RepID=A0A9P7KFR7_9AGAR|nr:hypothetical protein DXG03_001100 [Asterophora parasitica]
MFRFKAPVVGVLPPKPSRQRVDMGSGHSCPDCHSPYVHSFLFQSYLQVDSDDYDRFKSAALLKRHQRGSAECCKRRQEETKTKIGRAKRKALETATSDLKIPGPSTAKRPRLVEERNSFVPHIQPTSFDASGPGYDRGPPQQPAQNLNDHYLLYSDSAQHANEYAESNSTNSVASERLLWNIDIAFMG